MFDGIQPLDAVHQPTFERAKAFVARCSTLLNSDGLLPVSKFEFSQFYKVAPYICILGVIRGGEDFEVRLAGTRFVSGFLNYDPTGKRFSQILGDGAFGQRSWHIAREAVRTKQPVLNQPGRTKFKAKEFLLIESVNYPLVDATGEVVKVAGIYDFMLEKEPVSV